MCHSDRVRVRDLVFVAFFTVNIGFIAYMVDLEQLVVGDPRHFRYPLWPPRPMVDLVHRYGTDLDPLLLARPAFWRMTIWTNVLIILMEERFGEHATPHFPAVLALNLPWLLLPVAVIWRMRRDHPFTRAVPA